MLDATVDEVLFHEPTLSEIFDNPEYGKETFFRVLTDT